MLGCATNCSRLELVVLSASFNRLRALVGFVPATYSSRLLMPSPSESSKPSAALFGLKPYCSSHASAMPSPSVSGRTVRLTFPLLTPDGLLPRFVTAQRMVVVAWQLVITT